MIGNFNGIDLIMIVIDVIGMIKDGCVYVVIRNLLVGFEYLFKILMLFVNLFGWIFVVKKVVGVFNGFSLIGDKFIRSVVIFFNFGKCLY